MCTRGSWDRGHSWLGRVTCSLVIPGRLFFNFEFNSNVPTLEIHVMIKSLGVGNLENKDLYLKDISSIVLFLTVSNMLYFIFKNFIQYLIHFGN